VAAVVATAVNADGHREILGLDVLTSEDGAGWTAFLRDLVARGLSGARLVVSDDHTGLVGAVQAVLPGASWQRSSVLMGPGGRVPSSHHRRRERALAA
jgi:putative transposase